jgi:hypothetical protein
MTLHSGSAVWIDHEQARVFHVSPPVPHGGQRRGGPAYVRAAARHHRPLGLEHARVERP